MRRPSTRGRRVWATASTSGNSGILNGNRLDQPSRFQSQRVFARSGFGCIAIGSNDRLAFIPIGKLIGIVAAADLTGFACREEQYGLIPVGEIGDESHGGPMALGRGANAVARAGLRFSGDAQEMFQETIAAERMQHVQRIEFLPLPIL